MKIWRGAAPLKSIEADLRSIRPYHSAPRRLTRTTKQRHEAVAASTPPCRRPHAVVSLLQEVPA